MLQGYFDESGSEGQDSVVVLAGFISTAEKWARFSDEWGRLLSSHRPVFKMREESKRRPVDERNRRIAGFADVIKRNVLFKIECSVSVSAFRKIVRGKFFPENRLARMVDDHYLWVFNNLIARLCEGVWYRGYRNPFDLFFDEQLTYGPQAKKFYRLAQDVAKPRYRRMLPNEPVFRKDEHFNPLQAADMFAWIVRKYYNRDDLTGWQWLLEELKSVESMVSPFLDEERLTYFMTGPNPVFDERTIERWSKVLEAQ